MKIDVPKLLGLLSEPKWIILYLLLKRRSITKWRVNRIKRMLYKMLKDMRDS